MSVKVRCVDNKDGCLAILFPSGRVFDAVGARFRSGSWYIDVVDAFGNTVKNLKAYRFEAVGDNQNAAD